MKLGDLINGLNGLEIIAGLEDLPVKTAWKIAKVIRQANEPIGDFYKTREILIDKYKTDGELSEEAAQQVEAQLGTLLDEEVDITVSKINLDDLGDVKIAPRFLVRLDWLIED